MGIILSLFLSICMEGKAGMEVSIDYRFIVCTANLFSCIIR